MATDADVAYRVSTSEDEELGRSASTPKIIPPAAAKASRTEAAALLTLWSVLTLGEGTIRFIASDPARDLTPGGPGLAPAVLFVGGLFEAAFGVAGLVVGVAALLFRIHRVALTVSFLAFQTVLSFYVFIVYVFVEPAVRARDLVEPLLPGMSVGSSRLLLTMGILTSVSFCLALQGGQFVMGLRLLAYQQQVEGRPAGFASAAAGNNRLRAGGWAVNMLLGGLSTVVAGAVLVSQVTARSTFPAFYAAPPHVGVYPVLTLFTGLLMTAHGALGVATAAAHRLQPTFVAMTLPVYLAMYLNFAFVQVGGIGMGRAAAAGPLHNGLVVVAVVIAPYFATLWHRERVAAA